MPVRLKKSIRRSYVDFVADPEPHYMLSFVLMFIVGVYAVLVPSVASLIDDSYIDMPTSFWIRAICLGFVLISYPMVYLAVRYIEVETGPFKFPTLLFWTAPLASLVYAAVGFVLLVRLLLRGN